MSSCDCCSKYNCRDVAVAASLIIGVIAGVLRYTAVITVTPAFLWVVFGVAVGFLAVTYVTSSVGRYARSGNCGCGTVRTMLVGILGSILLSVILLAVEFAATSILGTIITGALLFFFALFISSAACLVKCLTACSNENE